MSSRLPTRYDTLRSDVNPFPPPSKRLRYDTAGYPTSVGDLTTNILQHEGVTTYDGGQSNETVDITLSARSGKSDGLTAGQLVFIDTSVPDIDSVMGLQEVNRIIAGILSDKWDPLVMQFLRGVRRDPTSESYMYLFREAQIRYIRSRFKFLGILSSNDSPVGRIRGTKAVNVSVWGDTRIFDYWSYGSRKLRAFNSCYLALRAVKISPDDKYQHLPRHVGHDFGESPENVVPNANVYDDTSKIVWQYIPVFNDKEVLTKKELNLSPTENLYPWCYWRLGKVHEFPTLPFSYLSDSRNFRSTSKSAATVVEGSHGQTIQFKLNCQKN